MVETAATLFVCMVIALAAPGFLVVAAVLLPVVLAVLLYWYAPLVFLCLAAAVATIVVVFKSHNDIINDPQRIVAPVPEPQYWGYPQLANLWKRLDNRQKKD